MDILRIISFVGWAFLSIGVLLFGIDFFLRRPESQISKEAHYTLIVLSTVSLLLGIVLLLIGNIDPSFFCY
jgi:hypothetical protein